MMGYGFFCFLAAAALTSVLNRNRGATPEQWGTRTQIHLADDVNDSVDLSIHCEIPQCPDVQPWTESCGQMMLGSDTATEQVHASSSRLGTPSHAPVMQAFDLLS